MLEFLRSAAGPQWSDSPVAEILARRLTPLVNTAYELGDDALAGALVSALVEHGGDSAVGQAAADPDILLPTPAPSASCAALALAVDRLALDRHERTDNQPGIVDVATNLGHHLAELGEYDEALEHLGRAAEVSEALAADHPEIFELQHPVTLFNLAGGLMEASRAAEALPLIERTVRLLGEVDDPDEPTRVNYARCLALLAGIESEVGLESEAVEHGREAYRLLKRLVVTDPELAPEFAMVASNLGAQLLENGMAHEAIGCLRTAVEVRRDLCEVDPVHRPGLSRSLGRLAVAVEETGDRWDAVELAEEALAIADDLAESNDGYLPDLMFRLNQVAGLYVDTGALGAALVANERLVAVVERLTGERPGLYDEYLVPAYKQLRAVYGMTGKRRRAKQIDKLLRDRFGR